MNLIQLERYNEAIVELEKNLFVQDDYHNLSLLYRLQDEYEKEALLVERALGAFPGYEYMLERQAWHQRPEFHEDFTKGKMVPREQLNLERNPAYIPKQETLENLIIVMGCNDNYFELVVENLESIKTTRWYADIPIGFLDSGLTDDQRHYLQKRFGVKLVQTEWDIAVEKFVYISGASTTLEASKQYKSLMNKTFMRRYFPNYEYYAWIDADAWVQDECCIDKFIKLAEEQGHGFCRSNDFVKNNKHFRCKSLPDEYWDAIAEMEHITGTFNCYNKEFALKTELIAEKIVHQTNIWHFHYDERMPMICMSKYPKKEILRDQEIATHHLRGLPFIKDERDVLYDPESLLPIGIYFTYYNKKQYYWYMQKLDKDYIDEHRVNKNTMFAFNPNGPRAIDNQIPPGFNNIVKRSQRYRVWPWQDRTEIKAILLKGVK